MVANKANILSNELATDAKDDKQRQALKNFENIYEGDSETAFHEYLTTQTNSWFALFCPQTNGSVANAKYYLAERFGLCEGQVHQVLLFVITVPLKKRLADDAECQHFLDHMVQAWCVDRGEQAMQKGERVFTESWLNASKRQGRRFAGLLSSASDSSMDANSTHTLRVLLAVTLEVKVP
jgi:hypothetical protein